MIGTARPCPLCGGARPVVVQTSVRVAGVSAELEVDAVGPVVVPGADLPLDARTLRFVVDEVQREFGEYENPWVVSMRRTLLAMLAHRIRAAEAGRPP